MGPRGLRCRAVPSASRPPAGPPPKHLHSPTFTDFRLPPRAFSAGARALSRARKPWLSLALIGFPWLLQALTLGFGWLFRRGHLGFPWLFRGRTLAFVGFLQMPGKAGIWKHPGMSGHSRAFPAFFWPQQSREKPGKAGFRNHRGQPMRQPSAGGRHYVDDRRLTGASISAQRIARGPRRHARFKMHKSKQRRTARRSAMPGRPKGGPSRILEHFMN